MDRSNELIPVARYGRVAHGIGESPGIGWLMTDMWSTLSAGTVPGFMHTTGLFPWMQPSVAVLVAVRPGHRGTARVPWAKLVPGAMTNTACCKPSPPQAYGLQLDRSILQDWSGNKPKWLEPHMATG